MVNFQREQVSRCRILALSILLRFAGEQAQPLPLSPNTILTDRQRIGVFSGVAVHGRWGSFTIRIAANSFAPYIINKMENSMYLGEDKAELHHRMKRIMKTRCIVEP